MLLLIAVVFRKRRAGGAGGIGRKMVGAWKTLGRLSKTLGTGGRGGAGGINARGTKVFSVVMALGGVKNP